MGSVFSKVIDVFNAIFFIQKEDQQSCKTCLSDDRHHKQHTDFNKLSLKISLGQKREEHIAKRMRVPINFHDHGAFFNKVCREGTVEDAKFLTTLHDLRMQYFKLLSSLFGSRVVDCTLPASASHSIDASRSWAVVIGIDAYENIPPLKCSVRDAQSFQEYLTTKLGIPEVRIQLLLGFKKDASAGSSVSPDDPMYPSRAHIITTLLSLIDSPHIDKGDNIIIYYAGHGSSYHCSDYTNVEDANYHEISRGNTGYIEALCPIDRDALDVDGNPIPDISDREFNTMLTLISRAKGHHITVILDCCHSASVSREVPPQGARTCRATERSTLRDMLHVGDKLLRDRPGYRSILKRDWSPDEESHVVLAACEAYQFAKERWINEEDGSRVCVGVFTHSLLRLLRSGLCSAETTYADLRQGFDTSSLQTPVVAGTHQNSRLWYQDATHTTVVEHSER
ncbi:caspase domain-containing protein [Armillaria novae-zelandiae]|uniref:Caspase domain-containing protein n=1 Tax=Armillaria novae-zelandiae TaxID=153914 RepID=A0AA39UE78_9AGAR|nr:caspase domain-containing protein [Armillaria novae-zelandiae]